jgi:caffeoyl-CoA O-methyltransferase
MSNKYLAFDDRLVTYIREISLREPEVLRRLREETATHHQSQMQLQPEQGQFLAFLIEVTGATRVLEIGTYTGYSALVMALALPAKGLVVTCDVNAETTLIAKRYWDEAGVAHRIESKMGPALETLDSMLDVEDDYFDLVLIDADKTNVEAYFERAYELVRRGGLIAIDNVLWSGKVADPLMRDEETQALRGLNRKLRDDARVSLSMLPIGDGMTLARKR